MTALCLSWTCRKYILFYRLGLKRTQNESPALLTFTHGLSRDIHERACQIFFERFNIAAMSVLERPLAQLFATNALTGLVVDIGQYRTDVTPINDCFIQHNCTDYIPIGLHDCETYLAHIIRRNEKVIQTLSPPEAPVEPKELFDQLLELASQVWKEGLVKIVEGDSLPDGEDEGITNIAAVLVAGKEKAVIETGMKKKASAKATAAELARAKEIEALDLVTFDFKGKQVTLGKERHRFLDPLFDPSLLHGIESLRDRGYEDSRIVAIHDLCGQVVAKTDLDSRVSIWDGLFVTGDCASLIKGLLVVCCIDLIDLIPAFV